jgi:hypothetical protein
MAFATPSPPRGVTWWAGWLPPMPLDLGYDSEPFAINSERRAILRAELDAWYARTYVRPRPRRC